MRNADDHTMPRWPQSLFSHFCNKQYPQLTKTVWLLLVAYTNSGKATPQSVNYFFFLATNWLAQISSKAAANKQTFFLSSLLNRALTFTNNPPTCPTVCCTEALLSRAHAFSSTPFRSLPFQTNARSPDHKQRRARCRNYPLLISDSYSGRRLMLSGQPSQRNCSFVGAPSCPNLSKPWAKWHYAWQAWERDDFRVASWRRSLHCSGSYRRPYLLSVAFEWSANKMPHIRTKLLHPARLAPQFSLARPIVRNSGKLRNSPTASQLKAFWNKHAFHTLKGI